MPTTQPLGVTLEGARTVAAGAPHPLTILNQQRDLKGKPLCPPT
jgi:hypothetical protein